MLLAVAFFAVTPWGNGCVPPNPHSVVVFKTHQNISEHDHLAEGFPFVFGFTVYESFESQTVAKSGKANIPSARERALGGHAVLAVGYDDKQKRLMVRNSWGPAWGQKGYFTMPYAYVKNRDLSDDFWSIRRGEGM